ncbi:MAG: MvaI/BcnI family restriction endonuclease [Candidatus Kapaibacterium sp.]
MTIKEIQNKLIEIHQKGFIESKRKGPTGIGYTLESELNLLENNLAIPDIGGRVELKASRRDSKSLVTLFTFNRGVWNIPQKYLIENYGYIDPKRRKSIYTTLYYNNPNPAKLLLDLDEKKQKIHLIDTSGNLIATWNLYIIIGKFVSKLERLIMVLGKNRVNPLSKKEEFEFDEAYLLTDPSPENFLSAFKESVMAIDLRMHIKETGAVRNHGTGFRIFEKDIIKLFSKRTKLL